MISKKKLEPNSFLNEFIKSPKKYKKKKDIKKLIEEQYKY